MRGLSWARRLHIRRNANPLRRYWLYLTSAHEPADPTIRSPRELSPARQIQVCGHCHGQRTPNPPERIAQFIMAGDPYTAGEDLSEVTKPIDVHTTMPGVDLSVRFWRDGTPRLTAYEYQGLLLSRGHENTKLTCISCHDMHGGDPKGMIEPRFRGNAGCLQCHEAIGRELTAHTKHAPQSSGSDCYACHMPKTTYGLLAIDPSHRITNPDPARVAYEMPGRPHALSHESDAEWAADAMSRQYGTQPSDAPASPAFRIAESVRTLFGGDVVQRAVAVEALSGDAKATAPIQSRGSGRFRSCS
jgi:predicted CXXCH cytochrome family protein